jgi:hypothetical protein
VLARIFPSINRRFQGTVDLLFDVGFALGMLVIVMAPLLTVADAWQVWASSHRVWRWARQPALGLRANAAYLRVVLFPRKKYRASPGRSYGDCWQPWR